MTSPAFDTSAVIEAMEGVLPSNSATPDSWNLLQLSTLLVVIVQESNDILDSKYINFKNARQLLETHPNLRQTLVQAWNNKDFSGVLNTDILKTSTKRPQESGGLGAIEILDLHKKLSESFQAEYHGVAVDGFHEYLTCNEELFRITELPRYYAKFCSIIQSSGTGKSRAMTELCKKDVVVLYMNLRPTEDKLAFPEQDLTPSQILTQFPSTEIGYRFVCYAFFISLFDTIYETISTERVTRSTVADIVNWVQQMCDISHPPKFTTRDEFFERFSRKYSKVCEDVNAAHQTVARGSSTGTPKADQIADELGKLSLSGKEEPIRSKPTQTKSAITVQFLESYRRVAAAVEKIFPGNPYEPKLVIALDEAHTLSFVNKQGYRPADILCRVINEYSHDHHNHAVWVVFASTTSKVNDFSPPNARYNSNRVAVWGERLFPPYTHLGWDQGAPSLLEGNEMKNVSQIKHIAGYGRPLWLSLKNVVEHPESVLAIASYKLCGANDFDPQKPDHALAVLGQRFGLSIAFGHPGSAELLETAVASHLRICLSTTADRNWKFTSYPSEPFLSCAATTILHKNPEKLQLALVTLLKSINSGMVDIGQRGELASRLLWLLSKDFFIREQTKGGVLKMPSTWEDHLADCQMIKVVDWLEFVFGAWVWETPGTRKAFENAYVNFSHWVCMETNISGSDEEEELCLEDWTQRHWQRTSAVQCCHQQPRVDKVIPINFDNGKGRCEMSQIFISDKARRLTSSRDVLHTITRMHKSLGGQDSGPPYIAILADMARPTELSATFPERGDDRCLRIYAAGAVPATYPFLKKYPGLEKALDDLVHLRPVPNAEGKFRTYLSTQVRFGSKSTPDRMHWERGRRHP